MRAADFTPPRGHAIQPAIIALPAVRGPIPVTPTSSPFAAATHSVTPRDLSKDGYLTSSASGVGLPMHQCASRLPPNDPRLTLQPRGVPIIKIINQTDITLLNRRPDSDTPPDLYRGYEVAGAAHVHDWVLRWGADDTDVAKTGASGFPLDPPARRIRQRPRGRTHPLR